MDERTRKISRWMLYMALIVTLINAYEFCTRVDAMSKPLKMFWNMAVGEGIPLPRVVTYVDISIFEVPLYLLCSTALGIWALWARRTRRGCAWMLAPCVALSALGFILPLTLAGKWVRAVRLLPMLTLTALCLCRAAMRAGCENARPPQRKKPADKTIEAPTRLKRRYRRAS